MYLVIQISLSSLGVKGLQHTSPTRIRTLRYIQSLTAATSNTISHGHISRNRQSIVVPGQHDSSAEKILGIPALTDDELRQLRLGVNIQKQYREERTGSGYVAMDIRGSPGDAWALLTDYAEYESLIDTVRRATIQPGGTPNRTLATYVLSKFQLEVSVVQQFDEASQQLSFTLDESSRNLILKDAQGIWIVESKAKGLKPGYVRVWLCVSIRVSRAVPRKIVDYAAKRALPRATTWLRSAMFERIRMR